MMRRTDNHNEMIHFQSGRLAQQNSEWFYMTRDGKQIGPFKRKEDAEGDLTAFIIYLQNLENTDY
ncbi:MAG: hypothetical protein KAJ32_05685 [Gammaproteobacteria bacterium]|nr:hypothetical protein [Gammaproteobacteria bacterium]